MSVRGILLIAVTPNGGACFVSDLYEGDIDEIAIFKESGILKHLEPGDFVMADRGFTVRELLNPRQVQLMIPTCIPQRKEKFDCSRGIGDTPHCKSKDPC